MFLNLGNFIVCGLQLHSPAGEFWELRSMHLKVSKVKKDWPKYFYPSKKRDIFYFAVG